MDESLFRSRIVEYSEGNGYPADHFAIAECKECGCRVFTVVMNEEQGVAARTCTSCGAEHGIADSDNYFDDVDEVEELECTCDCNRFEVMAAVSLYADSEDVRWFYLGCECVECGLSGVYGDWKCEFIGYQTLLDNV